MPAGSRPRPSGKQASRGLFGFEHRTHPLLPWPDFVRRMMVSVGLGVVFVGGSLALGMLGYHFYENLDFVDSFINAAMILSGMGPVDKMQSDGGKVFAGLYALYSGLAVLVTAGLLFAPMIHRMLHRFHADESDDPSK